MSKPDLPGSESLEEILASIRKTLADDRPDQGLSKLDTQVTGNAAEDGPHLNGAAHDNPLFQSQIVGALDGGSANDRADEEDLTDLLASELPTSAPKPRMDATPGRDPLWFLSRDAGAGEAARPAADRAEPAQAARAEEISLTRPETLRRSFPPLFGSGEATPARPAELPADRSKPAEPVETKPARLLDPGLPTPAAEKAVPAAPEPLVANPGGVAEKKPMPAPAEPVPARPEPSVEVAAVPVARAEPEPGIVANAKPVKAEPAGGAQSQVLQDMIAQLLEPVIQQWLDANLPRMVEAGIREEVARQIKGRGEFKI